MNAREFDLNIEKILENWGVHHAIREIIANAIDEEILVKSSTGKGIKKTEIFKDGEELWHIRDYGRGLNYKHLTQNENKEKLDNLNVIGKFGIGLKDAIATLKRKGVEVTIKSKHGVIEFENSKKHNFEDVITLHAIIYPPSDPKFVGTEFILKGCSDGDIKKAKDFFLRYSREKILEKTEHGEVLEKNGEIAKIYINGVKVAEEENFLFSYNITPVTKAIRKSLNRERINVGRSAYSDKIKSILLSCKEESITKKLAEDLENYANRNHHDELSWTDVKIHASRLLNSFGKIYFLTPEEIMNRPDVVDDLISEGYEIVTISKDLKEKITGSTDISGNQIRDLEYFISKENESFKFKFIKEKDMTPKEIEIFRMTNAILNLVGGKPKNVKEIKISETMRIDPHSFNETVGLWDDSTGQIIIKRSQLKSLEDYAGTLLHEIGHVKSGAPDVSRDFENELTSLIGTLASKALQNK